MALGSRRLRSLFSSFKGSAGGSVLVLTGLLLPIVAGASLFAVDHIAVTKQMGALQKAADAAAIATARELHFIQIRMSENDVTLSAIADSYARQNMPADTDLTTVATAESSTLVDVELSMTVESLLGHVFEGHRTLTASAKAEIFGGQNICIIVTDIAGSKPGAVLDGNSKIDAKGCGIYVNQQNRPSIDTKDSSFIEADFICVAGGYSGKRSNLKDAVTEDCTQIKDPLEGRAHPRVSPCNFSFPKVITGTQVVTLSPGTYCGGLRIDGNADVEFSPGIYAFDNGPLLIGGDAVVKGENVALFFVDRPSYFEFTENADITLSAPESGDMAGIVISARANCPTGSYRCSSKRDFRITSAKVRSLLGTIHLPIDNLYIDTTMPISEDAAFTILIIDNLYMTQSPVLVLNTDYAATTVPVPDGFVGQPSTRIVE